MTTSGSTGTPFTSYQNKEKRKRVYAEVLYYNGKVNYQIGKRIIYFRSVVGEVAKSSVQQFSQNIYLVDCTDLSDVGIENSLNLIAKLTRHSEAMVMGYASTMDAFRRYLDKYGFEKARKCNVSGVVSGSEMLYDETRTTMEQAFNCKCVSRYANEENGFLGQDYEVNNVFIPNRANYYIEILKLDSDEPAADGEVGRIIVTDLYNYAMPMIRYDTGDVGAWTTVNDNGRLRKAIGSFGGRKIDMVFNTKGSAISPLSFTNLMWRYQNVRQFQFAQISPSGYEMRIVKIGDVNEKELLQRLHHYVGADANINVVYLDHIASLKSGKKKYVTNEMKPL
jgi:phenylacetate-CoA ligase